MENVLPDVNSTCCIRDKIQIMTEYSNESLYQEQKPKQKINGHFKENGSKKGKVHLPLYLILLRLTAEICSRL